MTPHDFMECTRESRHEFVAIHNFLLLLMRTLGRRWRDHFRLLVGRFFLSPSRARSDDCRVRSRLLKMRASCESQSRFEDIMKGTNEATMHEQRKRHNVLDTSVLDTGQPFRRVHGSLFTHGRVDVAGARSFQDRSI